LILDDVQSWIAATLLYLLDLSPKTVIREIVIERIGSL